MYILNTKAVQWKINKIYTNMQQGQVSRWFVLLSRSMLWWEDTTLSVQHAVVRGNGRYCKHLEPCLGSPGLCQRDITYMEPVLWMVWIRWSGAQMREHPLSVHKCLLRKGWQEMSTSSWPLAARWPTLCRLIVNWSIKRRFWWESIHCSLFSHRKIVM